MTTMSDVTNIVVQCDILTAGDGKFLRSVDRWLRDKTGTSLCCVSHKAGGNKNLEISVAIGAFNHLPGKDFLAAIPAFADKARMEKEGGFIIVNLTTHDDQVHTWRLICE